MPPRDPHVAGDATFYGNVDAIALLLEHGPDQRLRDVSNVLFTPLLVAVFNAEEDGRFSRAKVSTPPILIVSSPNASSAFAASLVRSAVRSNNISKHHTRDTH